MPGTYHIIDSYPREQKLVQSLCGEILDRRKKESFCDKALASPFWPYDWCPECVRALPWNDEVTRKLWWIERGIVV